MFVRRPYICGPLTDLPADLQERIKDLYSQLGDICEEVLGVRAFVPHEHYDPIKHAHYTPHQVDDAERLQVAKGTSVLIVIAESPSWGGGIEVEIAYRSEVPVILLFPSQKKVSRLLRGNPGITLQDSYDSFESIPDLLRIMLSRLELVEQESE